MNNTVTQMAAISAAIRMLLSGNQRAKPGDLLIAATNGITGDLIETMMAHAADNRSTFLLVFKVDENTALLEKIMIIDASTKKGEIKIGSGKFVEKPNGSFAVRSINRDDCYEYSFDRSGRRLVRRAVKDDNNRAAMELRGLQALIAKSATPSCLREAGQLSVYAC
jgi:hypothetical protein